MAFLFVMMKMKKKKNTKLNHNVNFVLEQKYIDRNNRQNCVFHQLIFGEHKTESSSQKTNNLKKKVQIYIFKQNSVSGTQQNSVLPYSNGHLYRKTPSHTFNLRDKLEGYSESTRVERYKYHINGIDKKQKKSWYRSFIFIFVMGNSEWQMILIE